MMGEIVEYETAYGDKNLFLWNIGPLLIRRCVVQ